MGPITQILSAMERGDPQAAEQLLPLVYQELRQLAASRLSHEKPGHTLQATALVHEAYLRLVGAENASQWDSRRHFFSAAAESMKRILVENARRKKRQKHGGGLRRSPLEDMEIESPVPSLDLLALEEALARLKQEDPLKAEVVQLRFFVGLTHDEIAEILGLSTITVKRHWRYARAWLHRQMDGNDGSPS